MAAKVINGSVLEGGGQILRNAVSLSALLSKPIDIQQIRNGRKPPGLRSQHKTGLELAANISNANLTKAKVGSTDIQFTPGQISLPGHYSADCVTAGSITLLIQIALPLLLFSSDRPATNAQSPSSLTLYGGTNASMAPQVDYTKHVFIPFIRRHFGINALNLEIRKRGYYPKGGGEIYLDITPLPAGQKLKSVSLLNYRPRVKWIGGIAHFAGLPGKIGKEMVEGAKRKLASAGFACGLEDGLVEVDVPSEALEQRKGVLVDIQSAREPQSLTRGAGSGIVLWAELEGGGIVGGTCVGAKGISPQKVGGDAATELIKHLNEGGCVDEWLQDQIIIFMALAEGKSEVRCGDAGLSRHTQTAIWLAEQLTDAKFEVETEPSGQVIIKCQGIGYTAPNGMLEGSNLSR
ncbi:RTC domain-containing 1 [Panaeolus papilionaceus]|nr:RTC domain-containing 1 [Panaeolus papilionaceus]